MVIETAIFGSFVNVVNNNQLKRFLILPFRRRGVKGLCLYKLQSLAVSLKFEELHGEAFKVSYITLQMERILKVHACKDCKP